MSGIFWSSNDFMYQLKSLNSTSFNTKSLSILDPYDHESPLPTRTGCPSVISSASNAAAAARQTIKAAHSNSW